MTPEEYFKKHYVNKSNGLLKPAKWVMEFADSYHKKQLSIHDVVRQSEQLCIRCGDTKEEPKDDMCMCCWQKYKNAY